MAQILEERICWPVFLAESESNEEMSKRKHTIIGEHLVADFSKFFLKRLVSYT